MERYREYKDSGIQWLGQIPGHWKTMRGKNLFNKEQRPVQEGDDIVTCFRDGEVTLRKKRRISGFTEATDYSHYQHICKGDLVIHQMDAFAGSSGVSDSDGMGTPVLSVCTSKTDLTNNYYYAHILRLMGWNGYILSLYRGIRERSSDFRFDTFARLWLPVPPLVEQQAIVSYLDDKCAKIDKMLEGKQKQIELLAEMKQRIIAYAVTRGIDKGVSMKDSGVLFYKLVPETWKMKRMKYLFKERSEKNHPEEQMLSATQTEGVIPQSQYANRVVVVTTGFEGLKLVKVGDFVIHLRSFQGGIEISYAQGIISSAYTVLEPINAEFSPYFRYLFKSSNFIDLLKTCVTGIREGQNINYSKLKQFFLPVPPLHEQQEIVAYIKDRTAKIDTLSAKLQQEIERVKEYKQRLISDVVTGQIKVC